MAKMYFFKALANFFLLTWKSCSWLTFYQLIYQSLYLIYCFLFNRCLQKSFEQERNNRNKDGNSQGVTTTQLPQKEIGMMKFLALTSYLLARITLTLISSFAITGCFHKVNFYEFNLVILNFELHLHSCMYYVSF